MFYLTSNKVEPNMNNLVNEFEWCYQNIIWLSLKNLVAILLFCLSVKQMKVQVMVLFENELKMSWNFRCILN